MRTPPTGIRIRSPRDTGEEVRDLGRAFAWLADRVLELESEGKDAVRESAKRRWWAAGVAVTFAGSAVAALIQLSGTAQRDDVAAQIDVVVNAREQRARALELELESLRRDAVGTRAVLDLHRADADRRFGNLEKRRRR